MNETIKEEELDREVVYSLECPGSKGKPHGWGICKAKVSKKNLIFETGYGREIRFEKRRFIGDGLQIGVAWSSQKTERCSLGHDHPVGKESLHHEHGTLQWEYVESLIDWLNDGSFSAISSRRPGWINIMQEVREFLKHVESDLPKPLIAASQKLRTRMSYQLKEAGIGQMTGDSDASP